MLIRGDLFDVLPTLPVASVDACVTDPPYGIGFMGREWDTFKPEVAAQVQRRREALTAKKASRFEGNPNLHNRTVDGITSASGIMYDGSTDGLRRFQGWTERWAVEVLRVLKPGAYIVVCGAPRSHHRMMCGLEDAGFVVRDCFAWLFGSGFPKNHNLGDGRGTALKPAHEPIALAWKPFKGSISGNVEKHGTGALNIDACRIGEADDKPFPTSRGYVSGGKIPGAEGLQTQHVEHDGLARWPANVILDDEAADLLDEMTGELPAGNHPKIRTKPVDSVYGLGHSDQVLDGRKCDAGGASRFYYVAKPSREERDYGTEGLIKRQRDDSRKAGSPGGDNPRNRGLQPRGNFHPTVKPVALMRWLVRLVTPPNGTVLDPFTGSGTTGMACRYEQREFIGIEREAEYADIAERRIAAVCPLFSTTVDQPETVAAVREDAR